MIENYLKKLADMQTQSKELVPDSLKENRERRMIDYRKYINALRQCAKEHEKDFTGTGCIRVSDLCNDTADLLESLEKEECDE